jgi:hypothetical protein
VFLKQGHFLQCIEKTGIQTAAVTELGFSPEMHT